MSPVLSLIVYGQVYFLGSGANIRPTVIGSDNSIAIPAIDQTLDKTQPFEGNQNSVLVPEINRRRGEIGLSEKNVKRPDYKYTSGIGAHKLHIEAASWNSARRNCQDEGGHLAIINSVEEAQVISKLVDTADIESIWIGAHDLFNEDEFVTIEDESIYKAGYSMWERGEPNNAGSNEHCLAVKKGGKFDDRDCKQAYSYVCEIRYPQVYV